MTLTRRTFASLALMAALSTTACGRRIPMSSPQPSPVLAVDDGAPRDSSPPSRPAAPARGPTALDALLSELERRSDLAQAFREQTCAELSTTVSVRPLVALLSLYASLLGRFPQASELRSQIARMGDASGREAVALTLLRSEEALPAIVESVYQAALGRAPDAEERWRGMEAVLSESPDRLLATLVGTAEYLQRNGGTDMSFVRAAHRDLLDKAGTPESVQAGLSFLNGAVDHNRRQLALRYIATLRYRTVVATRAYQLYLGRAPAQAEIDATGDEMQVNRLAVIARVVGSDELIDRQTARLESGIRALCR